MAFGLHHRHIDWASESDRRIVAASLVQGAYNKEKDRRNERMDETAEAIGERLGFEIFECLSDIDDGPCFAIVYKYKHGIQENRDPEIRSPKYVIAFRGTHTKHDFVLNFAFILHKLHRSSSRFEPSKKVVENIIYKSGGPENVWLAGHSIGSAIALMVGKSMVMNKELYLNTYLFNPPFIAYSNLFPSKHIYWFVRSIVTAGQAKIVHRHLSKTKVERDRVFKKLNPWKPKVFVNNRDFISNEYISYYKQRVMMHNFGETFGRIEDIATQNSVFSLFGELIGHDLEPIHFIPSAELATTEGSFKHPKKAHGIGQWQKADLSIVYETYLFRKLDE